MKVKWKPQPPKDALDIISTIELVTVQFNRVIIKVTTPDGKEEFRILDKGETLTISTPIEVTYDEG